MSDFYRKFTQAVLVAVCIIAATPPAWSASFTVANGETLTSTQTLVNNETGLIVTGGFIVVLENQGVVINGDNATFTNNGTIDTTGGTFTNNGVIGGTGHITGNVSGSGYIAPGQLAGGMTIDGHLAHDLSLIHI